jgi:hypothetical protein
VLSATVRLAGSRYVGSANGHSGRIVATRTGSPLNGGGAKPLPLCVRQQKSIGLLLGHGIK